MSAFEYMLVKKDEDHENTRFDGKPRTVLVQTVKEKVLEYG